jgi:outer membrane protein assembly factor BamA
MRSLRVRACLAVSTGFIGQTGVRPLPLTNLKVHGGYLLFNVEPKSDPRFAITQNIYSPAQAPGIERQSNFLRGGGFLQIDYRDNPGGPRKGGNYLVRYSKYSDRSFSSYNFNQVELELQQYIPFVNERRVIALRGRANLTDAHQGNRVPFYLQPSAGGSNDLRGFRAWRFHDENSLILNAEYRWEVFSGMDMALFADAGKVFPEWGQLNFANMESSVGFGLRFNVRNSVFLRIDTGFSHEGFQIWFKFNNVF